MNALTQMEIGHQERIVTVANKQETFKEAFHMAEAESQWKLHENG